ncbi:MAG: Lrp/AsnC family transcriptional regulator [Myxococcota bacterium]
MFEPDETDRRLLIELQRDASRPVAELAQTVGLSTSPAWRRIRRLEEEGFLTRTVALVDRQRLGIGLVAFAMVSLSKHDPESVAQFEEALRASPEVQQAHAVTGEKDFIVQLAIKDVEAYQRFLAERLLPLTMIQSINTSFALRVVKESTALPIE